MTGAAGSLTSRRQCGSVAVEGGVLGGTVRLPSARLAHLDSALPGVVGRCLATAGEGGVTLDPGSVDIYRTASVATPSGRPRPFNKKSKKGTSDHLPLVATLTY